MLYEWISTLSSVLFTEFIRSIKLSSAFHVGLVSTLLSLLAFILICVLYGGGLAFVQHFVLRFFLWRNDLMPFHIVPFLDYAADRILLRRVGGGYIFIHRLLLEYFASLDTTP